MEQMVIALQTARFFQSQYENRRVSRTLLMLGLVALVEIGGTGLARAACLNVRDFGATGDGSADDRAAIQAAITASMSLDSPIVCFPAGRYRITHALRPEVDGLTMLGSPGAVIIADPDLSGPLGGFSEAILVNKGFPNLFPVYNLTIESLAFEVTNGLDKTMSAGVIQLNDCQNCLVSGVSVKYTGPTPKPSQLDGIVATQGTTGSIENTVVDGIPKAGIYLCCGAHDFKVSASEVKNTNGPIGATGFSITGVHDVMVVDSQSHDNRLDGMLIVFSAGTGPITNIKVVNTQCDNNGAMGVHVTSGVDGSQPNNLELVNTSALNNGGYGIYVEAGSEVAITNATAADNRLGGIFLDNIPIGPNFMVRTAHVSIQNPTVFDNWLSPGNFFPGIVLRAVRDVTLSHGRVFRTTSSSGQIYGLGLFRSPDPFDAAASDLTIVDINAVTGLQFPPVVTLDFSGADDPLAASPSGYYRLRANGSPEGALAAPTGSNYFDLLSHQRYVKASGFGPTGWVAVP
jgi:hypothetical protein